MKNHSEVIADFKKLGIIKNEKIISKKKFVSLSEMHNYGSGRYPLRIVVIGKRDFMYGFYPFVRDNKKQTFDSIYEMLVDFINGNNDHLKDESIQFGNCGVPVLYGDLRYR